MSPASVQITDCSSHATATILTGFGFNCFRFEVPRDGKMMDVLWAAPNFSSGNERSTGSGIPLLFPFPGRVLGNTLSFKGTDYSLPEGDGLGNAIHGFVHARPWRVIDQSDCHVSGQFQASIDEPELQKCWPADFRITATYRVEGCKLLGHYLIENPAQQELPCGLGTHPYFRLPLQGTIADDCVVQLPVSYGWELRDMIVTGRKIPLENGDRYRNGIRFGEMALDNVFGGLVFENDLCVTSIVDPESGCMVRQSFDRAFQKLVVYNPPHREAVCIEPYSCLPDPVRLERENIDSGLWLLLPGESRQAHVVIEVV